MKKQFSKTSLVLLFLCSTFLVNAQNEKKHLKFEKKLNEFRYSLYADFENIKELNELFDEPKQSQPVLKKIEDFIDENKQEIFDYQEYSLSKYKDQVIKRSSYIKDTLFFGKDGKTINPEIVSYSQMIAMYGRSIGRLMTLHPINHALTIKSLYLSRNSSVAEMGTQSMKDAIASPKIKCTEVEKLKWKIWFDNYSHLYEFDYEIDKNEMKMVGVYVRKK